MEKLFDFNSVKRALQISEYQFGQLDALDGSKDNKITKSIYDLAKEIRQNEQEKSNNKDSIRTQVSEILEAGKTLWNAVTNKQGITHVEAGTTELYKVTGNKEEQVNDNLKDVDLVMDELFRHWQTHKSLSDFKCTDKEGLLAEFDGCTFESEYFYNDRGGNDVVKNGVTEKNPDGITMIIKGKYNGKDYVVKKTFYFDYTPTSSSNNNSQTNGEKIGEDLFSKVSKLGSGDVRKILKNGSINKDNVVDVIEKFNKLSKDSGSSQNIMQSLTNKWGPTVKEMNIIPNSLLEQAKTLSLENSPEYQELENLILNADRDGKSFSGDYKEDYAKQIDNAIIALIAIM